ncbi:phage tail protein [Streptococcus equi]|uniref:phage tail protein n=1 Tax=Streptococcus equi TaxID=1336 RepID=UPI001BDDFD4F|nr:phage tail protein [Streptococcus equi]MBT1206346.1 phage tail protein [Streptococcus equi subsp. equi]
MQVKTKQGVFYVNADYTVVEKQGDYPKLTCTIPIKGNETWIADCQELDRLYPAGEQDEFIIINPIKVTKGSSYDLEITAIGAFHFEFVKARLYEELPERMYTLDYLLDLLFKDSRFSYKLQGDYSTRRFSGFGDDNKLTLFHHLMERFQTEFKVVGKVVLVNTKVGKDTGFQFRYLRNIKDTKYSVDVTNLMTYVKGYGAWFDENDHSKGRLIVDYESPLSKEYGKLDGKPVVDERMSLKESLIKKCKLAVDRSVSVSLTTTLVSLKQQDYQGAARIGDSIWFIDERISIEKKIRFSVVTTYYNAYDDILKQDVTLGDKDTYSRYQSLENSSQTETNDFQKAMSSKLAEVQDDVKKTHILVSGTTRIFFSTEFPQDNPKGTIKEDDILYRNHDGTTLMYRWNGVQWELVPLVNDPDRWREELEKQISEAVEKLKQEQKVINQRTDKELEEFRDTLKNLSLPEEAIKKITEAIKVDDIPSIKQSFDDLKNKVSETSETARLNAEIIGTDGKTRYNKNLLVGDPNRTKTYDQDYIELEANDGGFRRGETYTISFSQTCELLKKVAITLTQANNKGVKLVLTPTKAKMEAQTFNLSKDKEVISVYPLSYRAALTGDWYKSKQTDLNAAEVQDLALEMSYKEVVDGNNAAITGQWSDSPQSS